MCIRSLIFLLISYCFGAIPVSYLLCKKIKNIDPRTIGSGNVGATNAARILGKKWFFIITIIDALKGFIPVYTSLILIEYKLIYSVSIMSIIVAFATIIGHIYPVYLNFKGGKGVAVSTGVFLAFDYRLVLVGLIIFILVVSITKYISAGSVTASISLPITYYILNKNNIDTAFLGFVLIISFYVIYKHRDNIKRILQGKERKWGEKV